MVVDEIGVIGFERIVPFPGSIAAVVPAETLLLIAAFGTWGGSALRGAARAIGGLFSSRKVGESISPQSEETTMRVCSFSSFLRMLPLAGVLACAAVSRGDETPAA